MSDQRVGRHIRIYEWDEVDVEETSEEVTDTKLPVAAEAAKKTSQPEQSKGLSGLLKRKIF